MSEKTQVELLLKIASEYSEEEMDQVVSIYRSPEVFYHFSPLRKNLISWYDGWKDKTILEVGSECGALTSYFSGQACKVTCLEQLSDYQTVNRTRNRAHDNIEYVTGKLENLPNQTYDMIFVGSAFAKACCYIDAKEEAQAPFSLLRALSGRLNQAGKMVLAVENRMGYKYFAGAMEEYSGAYFGGIEGKTGAHGERTFTSLEMKDLFGRMSEFEISEYYPYPDYRFPMTIYSPQFLPKKGELNLNGNDIYGKRLHLFDETKGLDLILEHGLFPFFSNSYFYIMEKRQS